MAASWSISTVLLGMTFCLLWTLVNSDVDEEGLFRTQTSSVGTQSYSSGFNLGNLFGVHNTAKTVKTSHTDNYSSQYAHSNVLQNTLQIVGVPITHTIESNIGSYGGGFRDTLNIGGVGLSAGINKADLGLGLRQTDDGGYVLKLGALNVGLGKGVNAELPGSGVSAVANGHGAHTDSETNTNSQEKTFGLLTVSQSETQSTANANSFDGQAGVSYDGYVQQGQYEDYKQQPPSTFNSHLQYHSNFETHQHHHQPQQQHYESHYQQQPQIYPQHHQTQEEYEAQYYKDYYDNYYKTHNQPAQTSQSSQSNHHTHSVQQAPVNTNHVQHKVPIIHHSDNQYVSVAPVESHPENHYHPTPNSQVPGLPALPGGRPGQNIVHKTPVILPSSLPSLPGGSPGTHSTSLNPADTTKHPYKPASDVQAPFLPGLPGGQPGTHIVTSQPTITALPGGQPGTNIIPVQPADTTNYKDHYDSHSVLLPSSYASDNYFEKPSTSGESNYYIAPSTLPTNLPDAPRAMENDGVFHQTPSHNLEAPAETSSPDNLDEILNNIFHSNEHAGDASHSPDAPGKSLFDLLNEKQREGQKEPLNDDNIAAGGDFGLDVRTVERRKRSFPETRTKRKAYGGSYGHYVDEDDDESDEDAYFHHHHHNHGYGRQHVHRQRHHYGNNHGHGHGCGNGYTQSHGNHDLGNKYNNIQPNVRPVHEKVDEVVPLAPFPVFLPKPTFIPTPVTPPQDIEPVYNFDVRSNFGNDSRRRRSIEQKSREKRDDSFVFGGEEEEAAPVEVVDAQKSVEPAVPAPIVGTEEDEFEECELGEEGCEPASLDSRFGFATGMRRRRPFGGVLQEILQDVAVTLIGQPDPYRQFPQQENPYQQYPQQQIPQQRFPQQQYPEPQYPQPQHPHQPHYEQQYPQTQHPHQPHHEPQYPQKQHPRPEQQFPHQNYPQQQQQYPQQHYPRPQQPHPQGSQHNNFQQPHQAFQQSADANTQSQNYQNEFGQFQQNSGSSQSSNLAADGSAGQLSSANTQQQSFQNQFGSGSKNGAQSQSANFDNHGNLALNNANANTQHTQTAGGGHRDTSNSGAHSTLQNQFGTSSNGAQSDTTTFNENGKRGSQSHGSSQSLFHGNDGSLSGSNSDATSGSFEGPFGVKGNQASSHSSSFNNGGSGGGNSASASASSGTGGLGGFGGGGAQAQSGSFGGGGGSQASAGSNSYRGEPEYYEDRPVFG